MKQCAQADDCCQVGPKGECLGVFGRELLPQFGQFSEVLLNATDVYATGGSGLLSFTDEKILEQQRLKKLEEQEELDKKAAAKAKKDAAKAAENSGPGRRGPEQTTSNEPIDPNHPKRRMVQAGTASLTGVPVKGGERIERAYWACVVAKVPIREQLKLFQDAFEKARGGGSPSWRLVQRSRPR